MTLYERIQRGYAYLAYYSAHVEQSPPAYLQPLFLQDNVSPDADFKFVVAAFC